MMGYLKVLVLGVALVAVIYVMTHMTPEKVSKGFEQAGLAAAPVAAGSDARLNICPTRVHGIVWPDGRKIQEVSGAVKAKWQAYNLDPVDIGSMDVEKWLSLHCQVTVANRDAAASELKPYLTFDYIDGTHEALDKATDGLYRFKGRTFDSPDLTTAISDLTSLANLQPQGP